jgi:integrase
MNLNALSDQDQRTLTGLLAQMAASPDGSTPRKAKKARKPETIRYWTEEEWDRFIKLVTNPMHRAMFIVAYHRGLRASETQKLQLSDVRLKDDRIQINRCKGSASGEFHMGAIESRALRIWLKLRGMDPGPLFRTRVGTGISQQMQDRLVKRYGELAGISRDKCHVHCLKHNCATHLLARGESLEDVQDHLGHRSIQSTERYAKFTSPRRQARDKSLRDW